MTSPRLLLIDRDPAVQQTVETGFSNDGFEVTVVDDGLSALDAALATTPDVILADYRMDGINVFRFLEKLKQKNVLKTSALVLLIHPGDTYDELTLRLVGVSDFVTKPVKGQELLDRVRRYVPAPTPVVSQHVEPPGDDGPVQIEDLLGWSPGASASPFSELSEEQSGFDLSAEAMNPSPAAVEEPFAFDQNEDTPTGVSEPVLEEPTPGAPVDLLPDTVSSDTPVRTSSVPVSGGLDHEGSGTPGPVPGRDQVERLARDVVEKIAWEVVPELADRALERIVKTIVERVVWETVPTIAEAAIKAEIERLKAETGQS